MCHSGQLRLEMCYKGSFFPFPPSLFLSFPSSPFLQLSLPLPSLPSPFLLPSFLFSFFHSISLNTIVWKTVVEEKCQEVQMQI